MKARKYEVDLKPASEKALEARLVREVKVRGQKGYLIAQYKFKTPSQMGGPDRMIVYHPAKAVWAEIKTTGKEPTPLQLLFHRGLKQMGFLVWVIDSHEKLDDLLNSIDADLIGL